MKRPLFMGALALAAAVRIFLWLTPSPSERFEALDGEAVRLTGTVCSRDGESFMLENVTAGCLPDGAGAMLQSGQQGTPQFQTDRAVSLQKIFCVSSFLSENPSINRSLLQFNVSTGKILCRGGREQPPLDSEVTVQGKLRCFRQAGTPGTFDARAYYDAKGVLFALECTELLEEKNPGRLSRREMLFRFRRRCSAMLEQCFSERDASVMKAMLLGEKQEMDQEIKGLYQENGIAHVLAVSGLHISFLGMLLYRLLRKLRLGRKASCLLSALAVWSYVDVIGYTPSSERALIMFLFYLGAAAAGRTYDRLTALGAAAVWILAGNPRALLDVGFLLSFAAVLGIELAVPCAAGRPGREEAGPGGGKRTVPCLCKGLFAEGKYAFLSGAAVSLFTLPAVLWYFYEFPLYAVILNLLVIPFMGVLLPLGFGTLLLGGFAVRAALVCSLPAHWILHLFEGLCRAGEGLPWLRLCAGRPAPVQAALFYVLVLSILAAANRCELPRLTLWCGFLSAACLLIFRPQEGLSVTMLDVGQGDCFVITDADSCFLVDGGSSSQKEVGKYVISPYLKYRGISRVDCVFLSHLDEDHYNGILELLEEGNPRLGMICLPVTEKPDAGAAAGGGKSAQNMPGITEDMPETAENGPRERLEAAAAWSGCRVCFLKAGDRLQAGKPAKGLKICCLYPEEGERPADRNDASEVLLLEKGTFRMLFTGDLGEEGERRLLEEGRLTVCQVLKVGHHGSAASTGEAFLRAVSPRVALISCAEHNRYGHPSPETLERLEAAGVRCYVTKDSGAVRIDAVSAIDVTETLCHDKSGGCRR